MSENVTVIWRLCATTTQTILACYERYVERLLLSPQILKAFLLSILQCGKLKNF